MIITDIIFKLKTILMIMTKVVETDRAVDWKLNIHRRGSSMMIIKMLAVIIIITIMMTARRSDRALDWKVVPAGGSCYRLLMPPP